MFSEFKKVSFSPKKNGQGAFEKEGVYEGRNRAAWTSRGTSHGISPTGRRPLLTEKDEVGNVGGGKGKVAGRVKSQRNKLPADRVCVKRS